MLFPFLKSKDTHSYYSVFSIDSSSVTLTFLTKAIDGSVHITHMSRVSLDLFENKDSDRMIASVTAAITKIFDGLRKQRFFDIIKRGSEIVFLFGSPWNIGWSDHINIEKEHEFRITQHSIDEGIKDSIAKTHPELEMINIEIMGYKLNGYPFKDPIHKVSKSMEISVYVSTIPKAFAQSLRKHISSFFPHNTTRFYPYNLALLEAISKAKGVSDCLIVIPEIKTTELMLVKNGCIVSEASIPFGSSTLAHNLFGAKSASLKEALLKTKRFVDGTLDIPGIDSVNKQVSMMKDAFLNQFRDVVWKITDSLVLPGKMYVVGRNLASHFVTDWINQEEYIKNTFTVDDFEVTNLRGKDVLTQKNLNGLFRHNSIPVSVAVSSQFVIKNKINN